MATFRGKLGSIAVAKSLLLVATVACSADEELARRTTWSQPSLLEVKDQLEQWRAGLALDPPTRAKMDALWSEDDARSDDQRLDRLASTFALIDQQARELVFLCRNERTSISLQRFEFLKDEQQPEFLRNNLRLLYGRWLTGQQLYNEALEQLENLQPQDVVDPASLLFYQSAVYHRLLNKEKGLATIEQLLENQLAVPHRYAVVAGLMEADLRPLKADSLNEISRLMDSIRVRLGQGRAGVRVRKEEDAVVEKLDKLIEQIEQQAQQSQSSSAGGQLRPSQPMQDSNPGGGTGPGNVDPKRFSRKDNWGNLPPKQRQTALQQLGKEYPSHYRDVIEEYFRKLARDDVGQP